ncbi:TetR/AcrR family transcriptional regulator [Neolewinella persica]|uniref:TetR/AcrR family transcriptional regulator n=1 Tax=Neolewinella persica TaxID=70998 RepID=UPI00035FB5A1|nr:TetR/AcrR family transcriptional regulator [Neolewinella persica]
MARTKEFDEQVVLEKARDLFWERGYTATSIRDLEEHLGISRSSIYMFFGGKRELYDRTLAAYRDENMTRLEKTLGAAEDLRQALIDLFTATARQSHPDCKAQARGCYVVNATTEMANSCAEALSFAAESREQFVAIMKAALARAQEQGKLEEQADPAELANYLFVCYNGLQVVVQTNIERATLVKAVVRGVEGLPWT